MHPAPRQHPPSRIERRLRRLSRWGVVGVAMAFAMGITLAVAQTAGPDRLIRMNGALPVAAGGEAGATEPVEFSIYDQETGGTLLWQETQVLAVDGRGAYTVFLGASSDGLPVELFAGGAARWLSVQRPNEPTAARTLLTAVAGRESVARSKIRPGSGGPGSDNADSVAPRPC